MIESRLFFYFQNTSSISGSPDLAVLLGNTPTEYRGLDSFVLFSKSHLERDYENKSRLIEEQLQSSFKKFCREHNLHEASMFDVMQHLIAAGFHYIASERNGKVCRDFTGLSLKIGESRIKTDGDVILQNGKSPLHSVRKTDSSAFLKSENRIMCKKKIRPGHWVSGVLLEKNSKLLENASGINIVDDNTDPVANTLLNMNKILNKFDAVVQEENGMRNMKHERDEVNKSFFEKRRPINGCTSVSVNLKRKANLISKRRKFANKSKHISSAGNFVKRNCQNVSVASTFLDSVRQRQRKNKQNEGNHDLEFVEKPVYNSDSVSNNNEFITFSPHKDSLSQIVNKNISRTDSERTADKYCKYDHSAVESQSKVSSLWPKNLIAVTSNPVSVKGSSKPNFSDVTSQDLACEEQHFTSGSDSQQVCEKQQSVTSTICNPTLCRLVSEEKSSETSRSNGSDQEDMENVQSVLPNFTKGPKVVIKRLNINCLSVRYKDVETYNSAQDNAEGDSCISSGESSSLSEACNAEVASDSSSNVSTGENDLSSEISQWIKKEIHETDSVCSYGNLSTDECRDDNFAITENYTGVRPKRWVSRVVLKDIRRYPQYQRKLNFYKDDNGDWVLMQSSFDYTGLNSFRRFVKESIIFTGKLHNLILSSDLIAEYEGFCQKYCLVQAAFEHVRRHLSFIGIQSHYDIGKHTAPQLAFSGLVWKPKRLLNRYKNNFNVILHNFML